MGSFYEDYPDCLAELLLDVFNLQSSPDLLQDRMAACRKKVQITGGRGEHALNSSQTVFGQAQKGKMSSMIQFIEIRIEKEIKIGIGKEMEKC